VSKKWTGRLVVDHIWHDEIEEAVNASGITNPHQHIAKWSKAVTEKFNSLTSEEQAEYAVIAEQ
jgi:phage terminase large subunit-like protein